jgi:hypothetical protein
MDASGLSILLAELEADCTVMADAGCKAGLRLRDQGPGHLEACAYELARLYNVLEKMLERICDAFEKRGDYHEKLIQRLNLRLEGIRPAFIPAGRADEVRELKGFRHVMRHAYDLTLRPDRLSELVVVAERVAAEAPAWCARFGSAVRAEQQWGAS